MTDKTTVTPLPKASHIKPSTYMTGFVLSVALTIAPFALVGAYLASDRELFSRAVLIGVVVCFAAAQLLVQSTFFLHLSGERKLRPTLYSTLFTILTLTIIVSGSIWIMNNLNYNMMHEHGTTEYIQTEENIDAPVNTSKTHSHHE